MFRFVHVADVPAQIDLLFEGGTPIAVNGIAMPLDELTESLTTIAGDHGIGAVAELPAPDTSSAALVLGQARAALASTADLAGSGVVRMKLHHGEHIVVSVSSPLPSHS